MITKVIMMVFLGFTSLNALAEVNCSNFSESDGRVFIHPASAVWLVETNNPGELNLYEDSSPKFEPVPSCHTVENCPVAPPNPGVILHGLVSQAEWPFPFLHFFGTSGSQPISLTINTANVLKRLGDLEYYASEARLPHRTLRLACRL